MNPLLSRTGLGTRSRLPASFSHAKSPVRLGQLWRTERPASEVADRFGYSTASVHQMATLLRKGRLALFSETKPGPKGPKGSR